MQPAKSCAASTFSDVAWSSVVEIKISTNFWYLRGRIAASESAQATEGRAQFLARPEGSAERARALDVDLDSSVVSLCSCAFSTEALLAIVSPLVADEEPLVAWERSASIAASPRPSNAH